MHTSRIALPLSNLPCGAGPSIERSVKRTTGVLDAYVNPATDTVYVTYDSEQITPEAIAGLLHEAGYETRWPTPILPE